MLTKKKDLTQKERISELLIKYAETATKEDRAALIKANIGSKGLISSYLNGTVYDLDKGLAIIDLLKKRYTKRESKLKAA